MADPATPSAAPSPCAVFRLSCWGLGTIAFTQLLVAGVGLAGRFHQAQRVQVVEKEVIKYVQLPAPAAPVIARVDPVRQDSPDPALPPPLPPEQVTTSYLPPAQGLVPPPIADPQIERLVKEAQKARVAGDMATAILKLEAARDLNPKEPNTLFETGRVYEDMAAADPRQATQASDAYQEVYKLGVQGAGSLFQAAAAKLRDGIQLPEAMRGELSLGRPRIFKDDDYQDGERVVVTVPIRSAPGAEIDLNKLEPEVQFYDSTVRDGIQMAATGVCQTEVKWITAPVDFADGEEQVQITYVIPTQSEQQVHLFGKRKYYGQVVTLKYGNEVMDTYAWPRHLASQSNMNAAAAPSQDLVSQGAAPEDPSALPPDFLQQEDIVNAGSVLPAKPGTAPQMSMAPIAPVQPTPLPR